MTTDSNASAAVERLVDSFLERQRRGERPTMQEYLQAHPELAEQIREVFPALEMLEEFAPDETTCLPAALAPNERSPPARLGEYRILREVGRGGMGVVYEAVQESLGRHVALKVLTETVRADTAYLERFRREAQSAARLHHSSIVPVFSVGEHDGVCYYAMQYIAGQTLAAVLQEIGRLRAPGDTVTVPVGSMAHSLMRQDFDLAPAPANAVSAPAPTSATDLQGAGPRRDLYFRNVARIGAFIADALAYAHNQGVVHRDVKPANLMLDLEGGVWLTDFGLAKLEGSAELTQTGDLLGTLRYAAPEQLMGRAEARSDVYSLGITLYEMATLQPAFDEAVKARLLDRILKEEPTPPGRRDPQLPRDLETIILKAIAKEPARRYATAAELAEDLRRFLADRPVRARRTGWVEHGWRWCRRNPSVAVMLTMIVGLLVALAGGGTTAAIVFQRQGAAEASAKCDAQDKQWRAMLSEARALSLTRRPGQRFEALARLRDALAIARARGLTEEDRLAFRNVAIACLVLADVETVRTWPALDGAANGWNGGFSFDTRLVRYARSDMAGNVSVRRIADDEPICEIKGPGNQVLVFLSPDGKRVVVSDYYGTKELAVWEVEGSEPKRLHHWPKEPLALAAFAPDSKRMAYLRPGQGVVLFDVKTGLTVLAEGKETPPYASMAFSPDGKQIAFVRPEGSRNVVVLCDATTGEPTKRFPVGKELFSVAWDPTGYRLAVWGGRRILMLDAATGEQLPSLASQPAGGIVARFDPSGDLLITNDYSKRTRLWDAATARPFLSFATQGGILGCGTDDLIATQNDIQDGRLRLLRLARGTDVLRRIVPPQTKRFARPMAYSPQDEVFAFTTQPPGDGVYPDGFVLFDARTGRQLGGAHTPQQPVGFDPDGQLLTAGADGLHRWVRQAERDEVSYGPPNRLDRLGALDVGSCAAGSGTGTWALLGSRQLLIVRDGERVHQIETGLVSNLTAISPDDRWVVVNNHDTAADGINARVFDTHTAALAKDLRVSGMCEVGFSPSGRWLWASGGEARLWKVGSWEEGPTFSGQPLAFAPDDRLAAAGEPTGVVRLVDPETGAELARLSLPDEERLCPCCFTTDGARLVLVAQNAETAFVWDIRQTRTLLGEMGLDWEHPALPPERPRAAPLPSIRINLGPYFLNQEAERFQREKRHPEAIAAWKKSLEVNRDQAEVHRWLALALLSHKPADPAAALEHAEEAVKRAPSGDTFFVRGKAHFEQKRDRKAIDDFTLAIGKAPDHTEAYHLRSHSHAGVGNTVKALADVDEAIRLRPDDAHFHDMRGQFQQRLKQPEEAARAWQRSLELKADQPKVCRDLAWLHLAGPVKLRDARRGLELAERAAALAKTPLADTETLLGLAHFRKGEGEKAAAHLTKATQLSKGMPQATTLFVLSLTYHNLGLADKARQSYEQAVAGRPAQLQLSPHKADLVEELHAEAAKLLEVKNSSR